MKLFMVITICLNISSNGVNGKSVDELEDLVLDQFVEVFDRIILNEKKHKYFVKKMVKSKPYKSSNSSAKTRKIQDKLNS